MNEYIKKMLTDNGFAVKEQQGGRVNKDGTIDRTNITMFGGVSELDMDKIVKTVIQECVNVINHRADTSYGYLDSKKAIEQVRQAQRDCATTLEYTFGLKEMNLAE